MFEFNYFLYNIILIGNIWDKYLVFSVENTYLIFTLGNIYY